MHRWLWRWIPVAALALFADRASWPMDDYRDFASLRAAHREGVDFRVTVRDRNAPVSVFAIHGGTIERGTEVLARELGPDRFNLYLFESRLCKGPDSLGVREGLCPPDRFGNLHLTSHHFDDPRALELANKSTRCMSLHGYHSARDRLGVMLGGLSQELKIAAEAAFRRYVPEVEIVSPLSALSGSHPANIVNRCREKGVQLEFSGALRRRLLKEPGFRQRVLKALEEIIPGNPSS